MDKTLTMGLKAKTKRKKSKYIEFLIMIYNNILLSVVKKKKYNTKVICKLLK